MTVCFFFSLALSISFFLLNEHSPRLNSNHKRWRVVTAAYIIDTIERTFLCYTLQFEYQMDGIVNELYWIWTNARDMHNVCTVLYHIRWLFEYTNVHNHFYTHTHTHHIDDTGGRESSVYAEKTENIKT